MAKPCCDHACDADVAQTARYRKVLWAALAINLAMFFVEVLGGFKSGSVSLMADAIDFFGDAANYGVSLAVLGMSLLWRARAAALKGLTMGIFGLLVLAKSVWSFKTGTIPEPYTMGVIGAIAWQPMPAWLSCCMRIARAMPISAQCGYAAVTMPLAILPSCLLLLAYLAVAARGQIY